MTISLVSAQVIGDYLRWLRARKLSAGTIRTARYTLHGLARRAQIHVLDVGRVEIEKWQADRAEELSPGTLLAHISYVKGFYRWAVRAELIETDPSVWLEPPKAPRRLPHPMPDKLFAAAMDGADEHTQIILKLAGFAGLRSCEIAGLDWSEVVLTGSEPQMRIVGKGRHERIVDVAEPLAEALAAMPRQRGPVVRRLDGMLGRNTPNRVSQIANEHLASCGIPHTLHSLRHRFGTRVNDEGGLRAAQEALGHASPTTTAIYTAVGRRTLRAAIVAAAELDIGEGGTTALP